MMHILALAVSIGLTVLGQFFLKTGSLSKAEGIRLFLNPCHPGLGFSRTDLPLSSI
jgi:hypothetical protein